MVRIEQVRAPDPRKFAGPSGGVRPEGIQARRKHAAPDFFKLRNLGMASNLSEDICVMEIKDWLDAVGRESAWKKIVEHFLPEGPSCPNCSAPILTEKAIASFFSFRRTWCKACERAFIPSVGTPLQNTSWKPEEFYMLKVLSLVGYSPIEIVQHLEKSPGSVRDMLSKVELLQAVHSGSPGLPSGSPTA